MSVESKKERDYNFESWIPNEKKPFVTFSRKAKHYCIYCGNESNTREHIPSRVFLQKPYPEDLAVLPACKSCNNSFSNDELYTEVYIDTLKHLSGYSNDLRSENKIRVFKNTAFLDAQNDLKSFFSNHSIPKNPHIERIILKLAIGHLVYELSEGYGGKEWAYNPVSLEYKFRFEINNKEMDEFDEFVLMNDKVFPEFGTRIYNNIFVFSPVLKSVNEPEKTIVPESNLCFLNWSDIQDDNYKYIAWLENEGTFVVKIVIHDFLFAHIIFKEYNEER